MGRTEITLQKSALLNAKVPDALIAGGRIWALQALLGTLT